MKKVFETKDVIQANFLVSILSKEKIPHTVTGLADKDYGHGVTFIEFFTDEANFEHVQQIVDGMID